MFLDRIGSQSSTGHVVELTVLHLGKAMMVRRHQRMDFQRDSRCKNSKQFQNTSTVSASLKLESKRAFATLKYYSKSGWLING